MSENEEDKKQVYLKPYTLKELSALYGMKPKTLRKWLKPFQSEIGEKKGQYFQIPQVRIIFEKLDLPSINDDE